MKPASISTLALLLCLALSPLARAQTPVAGAPATIDYQGQVLDTAGAPLAPATPTNYTMQFRIYDQQTAGNIIWAESQIVTVDKGAFSVRLGTGVAIPLGTGTEGTTRDLRQAFNTTERFLGLTVTIPGQPVAEITPRLAFLSSPYTLVAERAKIADTASLAGVASSVIQNSGNSTLGITTVSGFTLAGAGRVNGANTLEFGAGVADKEINAGKIGYGVFTPNTLDIIGAGTTAANRKIRMQASGGLQVDGPLTVVGGKITGDGSGLTGVNATLGDGTVTAAKLAAGSVDVGKLVAAVKDALCPPGTIVAYAGDAAPAGWLMCNGQAVSQSAYRDLFTAVGTRFGNDAGSPVNFNVPDFRGRFLRGRDGGTNRDPDRTSRTTMALGGATGDSVGSLQTSAVQDHGHSFKDIYVSIPITPFIAKLTPTDAEVPQANRTSVPWGIFDHYAGQALDNTRSLVGLQKDQTTTGTSPTSSAPGSPGVSPETRPANAYVNYIIKF